MSRRRPYRRGGISFESNPFLFTTGILWIMIWFGILGVTYLVGLSYDAILCWSNVVVSTVLSLVLAYLLVKYPKGRAPSAPIQGTGSPYVPPPRKCAYCSNPLLPTTPTCPRCGRRN